MEEGKTGSLRPARALLTLALPVGSAISNYLGGERSSLENFATTDIPEKDNSASFVFEEKKKGRQLSRKLNDHFLSWRTYFSKETIPKPIMKNTFLFLFEVTIVFSLQAIS